ncbi:MAG: FkbM family methyltransferase [Acidobacteria bacterium]|nr:FkbM family methyltransferase [Acidobacteriota bacterium]
MGIRALTALALKAFIALGSCFIVFEISCWVHPPLMAWGLAVAGRSRVCPPQDVYSGANYRVDEAALAAGLTQSARLRGREGSLAHWSTSAGSWWIPSGSEQVLPTLLAQQRSGLYSPKTFRGRVVLDCGAHIGLYTREAAEAGAQRIVAIEPSPENIACLRRNVEAIPGGKDRVTVYPKGVWDEEKKLRFFHAPSNSTGDSFLAQAEGDQVIEEIPVTTIDRIAAELKLPEVNLIKIDIKGATLRALNGAAGVVAKYHPRSVISTEELEDPVEPIVAWMTARGYRMRCGACAVSGSLEVSPTVLYFE